MMIQNQNQNVKRAEIDAYIEPKIKAIFETLAIKQGTSLSRLARMAILEYLNNRGLLPEDPDADSEFP